LLDKKRFNAEIEFSAVYRQCLDRRIPTKTLLASGTDAWVKHGNEQIVRVNGQSTTEDARIKLKHHYPQFQLYQTTTSFLQI